MCHILVTSSKNVCSCGCTLAPAISTDHNHSKSPRWVFCCATHRLAPCAQRFIKCSTKNGDIWGVRSKCLGMQAGWTPLMVASGNGHMAFMRFLLDEGCEPGIASESGEYGKNTRIQYIRTVQGIPGTIQQQRASWSSVCTHEGPPP